MSESSHYISTVMDGIAGNTVRNSLRRRGIAFRDQEAWATAKERADQLGKLYEQELEKLFKSELCYSTLDNTFREVAKLEAMLKAFQKMSIFKDFGEQTRGKELETLYCKVSDIKKRMSRDDDREEILNSSIHAQKYLEQIASEVQHELCQIEKDSMIESVSGALSELGYLVERRGDALKATLNQTCLWVEANLWSELSMDLSGYSGLSCLKEMSRVETQLKRQGLSIKKKVSALHGRPNGGVLARRLEPMFPDFKRWIFSGNHLQKQKKSVKMERINQI